MLTRNGSESCLSTIQALLNAYIGLLRQYQQIEAANKLELKIQQQKQTPPKMMGFVSSLEAA
jgi:hypothetical protein